MKKIILILCAFALVASLIACDGRRNQEMEPETIRAQWRYARFLNFVRRIVIDGEEMVASTDATSVHDGLVRGSLGWLDSAVFVDITPEEFQQSTAIHFYPSEAEARTAGHPDEVILVWPHEGALQGLSNRLYLNTLRWGTFSVKLYEIGVTLPLTIDDLLNNIDELGWPTWWGDTITNVAFVASKRGELAFTEEIEIFYFAGTSELDLEVRERLERIELDIIEDFSMIRALFDAAVSPEAFIAIADRMEAEGLTVEDAISILQE